MLILQHCCPPCDKNFRVLSQRSNCQHDDVRGILRAALNGSRLGVAPPRTSSSFLHDAFKPPSFPDGPNTSFLVVVSSPSLVSFSLRREKEPFVFTERAVP
jgi:hypothetical protein